MYQLDDTIVAVSSPSTDERVIVRISGPRARQLVNRVFAPGVCRQRTQLATGVLTVDRELELQATLYWFRAPRSYTGEDVAEIHFWGNSAVSEAVMSRLLSADDLGSRMAGPGEFTARAYLNGKMDLTQAEAVAEVIASSNRLQLGAAEELLAGRLGRETAELEDELMDCLSLIEAGLDFSEQDIAFITHDEAVARLGGIKQRLERLISGSISYESVVDMAAVGIAGGPNAGKSSLLNALLGRDRSIVSEQMKTTRDVLTGVLELEHCRCVLFDCAGLVRSPDGILDELSQQAAVEALRKSAAVVFCVDVSQAGCDDAAGGRELIDCEVLIPVASKCDLVPDEALAERLRTLRARFGLEFLPTSARTGSGVELLRRVIESNLVKLSLGSDGASVVADSRQASAVALTARHRHAVTEAIGSIDEAISEFEAGNDEVAAMLLRTAYQSLSTIEQQPVDEQILERIFSRFCIGK